MEVKESDSATQRQSSLLYNLTSSQINTSSRQSVVGESGVVKAQLTEDDFIFPRESKFDYLHSEFANSSPPALTRSNTQQAGSLISEEQKSTKVFGARDDSAIISSSTRVMFPLHSTLTKNQANRMHLNDSILSVKSAASNTGQVQNRSRLNELQQQQIKQRLSWKVRMKIYLYHFYEPFLIGVSLSLAMQVFSFTSFVYLLSMFIFMVPFILTRRPPLILLKLIVSIAIGVLALVATVIKSLAMIKIDGEPIISFTNLTSTQAKFWGVQQDQSLFIVFLDANQLFLCVCLLLIYRDQRKQAEQRVKISSRLEMQSEIKLHHPLFGNQHRIYYFLTGFFYLSDTFLMPNAIQLVILVLLLVLILFKKAIVTKDHQSMVHILRLIEYICICQAVLSFTISMPVFADSWQHGKSLLILGVCSEQDTIEEKAYSRTHYVVLCVAIVCTEVFIACQKVHLQHMQQEISKPNSLPSTRDFTNEQQLKEKLDRSGSVQEMHPPPKNPRSKRMSFLTNRFVSLRFKDKRTTYVLNSSQGKAPKKSSESCMATLNVLWKESRSVFILWLCRILAFTQIFCYHDWQSLVYLLWLLHSTIYNKSSYFRLSMLFFYLPLFTAIFLWYYIINIYGVVNWTDTAKYQTNKYYNLGFYQFTIAPLEVSLLFLCLYCMTEFCHLLLNDIGEENRESQFAIKQIQNRKSNILYQLFFILLIYIEYPLMIFLVIDGVSKMDIYHVLFIPFFLVYTLFPTGISKYSIILLIYADLFVLVKYIYTLVTQTGQPKDWVLLIGFSSAYDPDSPDKYFRYQPKLDQWTVVVLSLVLYRRSLVLGTSNQEEFEKYRLDSENTIKRRLPWLYRLYVYWDIFYNHTIVMIAFTIFLGLIILLPSSLINVISQTLVLSLLFIYLASGIRRLLKFWHILMFYQAVVLLAVITCQFLVNSAGYSGSIFQEKFGQISDEAKTFMKWLGFYKYSNPIWVELAPYVIMFSLSILLHRNFKHKMEIERMELLREQVDFADQAQKSALESDQSSQLENQLDSSKPDRMQLLRSTTTQSGNILDSRSDRINLIRSAATSNRSSNQHKKTVEEEGYIFQVGFYAGTTNDILEIQYHKQNHEMKYKLSYLAYKLAFLWGFLDFIASYFNLMLNLAVVAFAIYTQVSLFYGVCLLFFAIQSLLLSSNSNTYRRKMRKEFQQRTQEETQARDFEQRLGLTARQELEESESVFRVKQKRKNELLDLGQRRRSSRRMTDKSTGLAKKLTENDDIKIPFLEHSDANMKSQESTDRNVNIGTDEPSLLHTLATEEEDNLLDIKMLKITDEEAIKEYAEFKSGIHKMLLKARYFYWYVLMILLIVAFTLSYISTFERYLYAPDKSRKLVAEATFEYIVFLFFWGGVYCNCSDTQSEAYIDLTYPFYLILILATLERLAQIWIENRFGCSKDQILLFRDIETKVKVYKHQARKKRQEAKARGTSNEEKQELAHRSSTKQQSDAKNNKLQKHQTPDFVTFDAIDREVQLQEIQEEDDLNEQSEASKVNSSINNDAQLIGTYEEFKIAKNDIKQDEMLFDKQIHDTPKKSRSRVKSPGAVQIIGPKKPSYTQKLEAQDQRKKELVIELTPFLRIKDKLKILAFLKALVENIIIMLIWFDLIFKQNIYSWVLLAMLTYYTYHRSGSAMLIVRTTVSILLFAQYFTQVIDFSSYNSKTTFPSVLTGPNSTVYPNAEHFYLKIPFFMAIKTSTDSTKDLWTSQPVDLSKTTFWGLMVTTDLLNRLWSDLVVICMVSVYFSLCNLWLVFRPVKIVLSKTSKKKLKEYQSLLQDADLKSKSIDQVKKELEHQFLQRRFVKACKESLYMRFPIIMISIILAVAIFNETVISFGYIVIVMALMRDLLSKSNDYTQNISFKLKWILLPYLLLDVALQLAVQVPDTVLTNSSFIKNVFQIQSAWSITPHMLTLGDPGPILYQSSANLGPLMVKGLTFFVISVQLQVLNSYEYKSFIMKWQQNQEEETQKLGQGISYRFNNFKCKQVLQIARENEEIEKMLWQVKKLIHKRDKLYKVQEKPTKKQFAALATDQSYKRRKITRLNSVRSSKELLPRIDEYSSRQSDLHSSNQDLVEVDESTRIEQEIEKEQEKIKKIFEGKMRKLTCCQKLYLYLRRNFVIDLFFRKSNEHLDDMVDQLRQGRTSTKSNIEIGILNDSKFLCLKEREAEMHASEPSISTSVSVDFSHLKKSSRRQTTKEKAQLLNRIVEDDQTLIRNSFDLSQSVESDESSRIEFFLKGIEKQQDKKVRLQKQQMQQLNEKVVKSDIYAPSAKPWEQVKDKEKQFSWKGTLGSYFSLLVKVSYSHTEIYCYFWIVFQIIANPGLLYLAYPFALFGYVLVEEQAPGRFFWYSVIIYTQFLVIVTFALQLSLWTEIFDPQTVQNFKKWLDKNNIGIQNYTGNNFASGLAFYYSQIFLLLFVLMHVQKEIRSGVFDQTYEKYESFEQGLKRYRHFICNDETKRKQVLSWQKEDLTQSLDFGDPSKFFTLSYSEYDKFQRSEELGDPIYIKQLLKYLGPQKLIRVDQDDDDGDIGHNLGESSLDDVPDKRERAYSADDVFLAPVKKKYEKQKTAFSWLNTIFYDNSFFRRLFPVIVQQKPGEDLYVFIAAIQIAIVSYIFVFFNLMVKNDNDTLTKQIDSNSLSGEMVIFVLLTILIMVMDRILYSSHHVWSRTTERKTPHIQDTDYDKMHRKRSQSKAEDSYSVNYQAAGQNRRLNTTLGETLTQENGEQNDDTSWFSISDDSDELEVNFVVSQAYLTPKKIPLSGFRVLRFYYLWMIIILMHYIIFFFLPQSVRQCQESPQIVNGEVVNYGESGYNCNQFKNNGFLKFFYFLWCIYFCLSAYQIKVGLPEIRRGSFLVNTFNIYSSTTYRAYLAIPFIFELRSIIDWTFTKTALDVFQWIKLAQVQADMYIAKCINKDYMRHKLGQQQAFWKKLIIGFSLTLFVLALLIGPIIIFSGLNPYPNSDPVTGGRLYLEIQVANQTNSQQLTQSYTLYATQHLSHLAFMNETQYDALNFNDEGSPTSKFGPAQSTILQFSSASSYQWQISPPDLKTLNGTLYAIQSNQPGVTLKSVLSYEFFREGSRYGTTDGQQSLVLNQTDNPEIIQSLINQINCISQNVNTTLPEYVTILQQTGSSSQTTPLLTPEEAFKVGYTLGFFCEVNFGDADHFTYKYAYWTLTPLYTNEPDQQGYVKEMQNDLFLGRGFGFFVFTAKTLPNIFADYGTSIVVFYISVIFVIAAVFRSAFVPKSYEIFITDAPYTDDILKICQSISIFRLQRELEKEEELYHILIDIMRSPEMIKSVCGSSLKKKLQ